MRTDLEKIDFKTIINRLMEKQRMAGKEREPRLFNHRCHFGWELLEKEIEGQMYSFAQPCPVCQEKRTKRIIDMPGECSWETWQDVPDLKYEVERLKKWKGGAEDWCFVLCAPGKKTCPEGNRGSGKTHALSATALEWVKRGIEILYHMVPYYLADLEEWYLDRSQKHPGNLETFKGLLILDDLGMEDGEKNKKNRRFIDRLIDVRYRNYLPTLIASNLDAEALESRYPRAWSRMNRGTIVSWAAPDRRKEGG